MKNKYRQLKWRMMFQTMTIMLISLIIGKLLLGWLLQTLFQGEFSNLIIGFLMKMNFSRMQAEQVYQKVFYRNREIFPWIAFMVMFLFGYYLTLSRTTAYLKSIGDGIDNILSNSEKPIELKSELEPIAEKLNLMKMTLKRKERMAQESEQRKNDLVVYLAHDLKTPLTSVIAYLNLLEENKGISEEEKEKYIHIAYTKSIRLSELIREFFEITRFHLQSIRLEKETINLSLMLEQMVDEFYAVLKSNHLTGTVHAEENLFTCADPDKLARVFDNLMRNAAAYSYRGTNIDVRAYGEGQTVVVVFSNQGEPIPKQKLQSVFEKFYRADEARSSQTGGSGLGLSVAKEIVERHEGTIEAFSDVQSTRFVVRLKRVVDQENL